MLNNNKQEDLKSENENLKFLIKKLESIVNNYKEGHE